MGTSILVLAVPVNQAAPARPLAPLWALRGWPDADRAHTRTPTMPVLASTAHRGPPAVPLAAADERHRGGGDGEGLDVGGQGEAGHEQDCFGYVLRVEGRLLLDAAVG